MLPGMQEQPVTVQTDKASAAIAMIAGLLVLLMSPRLVMFVLRGGELSSPFLAPDGSVVPYTQTAAFWSDLGLTGFAIASLAFGAVLLAKPTRPMLSVAFGLMALAGLMNAGVVVGFYAKGLGLAMVSLLAAIFSIWNCVSLFGVIGRSGSARSIA